MFADFASHFSEPTEVAIVIIDESLHRERLAKRDRWPKIDDWELVIVKQIENLKKLAEDYNVPIFSDFYQVNKFQVVTIR